jgi:cysteine desulfurase
MLEKAAVSIYLDFNASTPIAPEVAAVMRPLLDEAFGNPSSTHWAGVPARRIIEEARAKVADLIGAEPDEIVFTSGGSESNNTAIKGACFARGVAKSHVVTAHGEHPATLESCRFLEKLGARITLVDVGGTGRVDPATIAGALLAETALVTIMHANNETGTIQPIAAISEHTKRRGVLFHCDAAQSAGKIPVRVNDLGVDLLSIAGHKLYAPKGIGALYWRRGVAIEPLLHGGNHERGRRAGTESAILAAALGEACRIAKAAVDDRARITGLRDHLFEGLRAKLGDRVVLNGHPTERLPNTLNVNFVGEIGADVIARLQGVAASTGSACHAGDVKLSPVLKAMGVAAEIGKGAVRFSLGRSTSRAEIDGVLAMI